MSICTLGLVSHSIPLTRFLSLSTRHSLSLTHSTDGYGTSVAVCPNKPRNKNTNKIAKKHLHRVIHSPIVYAALCVLSVFISRTQIKCKIWRTSKKKARTIGSSEIYLLLHFTEITDESVFCVAVFIFLFFYYSFDCFVFYAIFVDFFFRFCFSFRIFVYWWFFLLVLIPYRHTFYSYILIQLMREKHEKSLQRQNASVLLCRRTSITHTHTLHIIQVHLHYAMHHICIRWKKNEKSGLHIQNNHKCIRLIYFNGIIKAQLNDTAIHDYLYNYCNLGEC